MSIRTKQKVERKNKQQFKFPEGHNLVQIDRRVFNRVRELSDQNKESIASLINRTLLGLYNIPAEPISHTPMLTSTQASN